MKIIMLLLLVISISYTQSYRSLPFPKPVIDPEPPGFNPVEPIYPRGRPCKKVVCQHENYLQKILELNEKIAQLELELEVLEVEKPLTCLGEIKKLDLKIKAYEKSKNVELILGGSASAYGPLMDDDFIDKIPRFFKNIRYTKANKISCVLNVPN
ncbi:MAG: hypothetical protein KC646_03230 [Candidatus Cloacimonetes bacterium]|nr:hypothetical protein [Candidatus Cloacimonadota bacterium]